MVGNPTAEEKCAGPESFVTIRVACEYNAGVGGKNAADQLGKTVWHPAPVRQEFAGVRIDQHQAILSRFERREAADSLENVTAGASARLHNLDIDLIVADHRLCIGYRRLHG